MLESEASGSDTPKKKENHSELTAQLTEVEAEQAKAKEQLADVERAVTEAQDEVNEAKSGN